MPDLVRRAGRLVARSPRGARLDPVRPSAGLAASYRARLEALVDELHASVVHWLRARWRAAGLAEDASPVSELRALFRRLGRRWERRFDDLAPRLADHFARRAADRVDARLAAMLREAGVSVAFVTSRGVRDAYQAAVAENVTLIRSVAAEHLDAVERLTMASVATGRDLAALSDGLRERLGVTRRRAAAIARDQNNKATAAIVRARQQELGITHARWVHSAGGRHPRPSHVRAGRDGVVYEVARGWFDPDAREWTWPGVMINCRCVSRPVVPGFG